MHKVALTTGRRTTIRPREQPAGGFLPDPEHPGELPEPPAPGGELADRAIERLHYRTELAALPARQRRLLALQAVGVSYAEIAGREGCTPRTVERQLLRARRSLQDADPQPSGPRAHAARRRRARRRTYRRHTGGEFCVPAGSRTT